MGMEKSPKKPYNKSDKFYERPYRAQKNCNSQINNREKEIKISIEEAMNPIEPLPVDPLVKSLNIGKSSV